MKWVMPYVYEVKGSNLFERIEDAGRICYASSDKKQEGSAIPFVERLYKNKHTTPLEQCAITVKKDWLLSHDIQLDTSTQAYPRNKIFQAYDRYTGTVLAFLQAGLPFDMLKSIRYEIAETHKTIAFCTSRAIANQLVRHRSEVYDDSGYLTGVEVMPGVDENSMVQQSTRYVNFTKHEYGIVRPVPYVWAYDTETPEMKAIETAASDAYDTYERLIQENKLAPQAARMVLPLVTATTVVMSGYIPQWLALIELRLAKGADPCAQYIAAKVWDIIRSYVNDKETINKLDSRKEVYDATRFG